MPPFDGSSARIAADIPVDADLLAAALEIVCEQLESPTMQELWALHHFSRADENVPAKISAEIRKNMADMNIRPDLLAFAAEFLLTELRTNPQNPALAAAYNILPHAENIGTYKARRAMPEDCKEILDMLDIQFQQRPFSHFLGDVGAEYAEHLKDSAKKHPRAFTGLLVGCVGAGSFLNANLGPSKTYIDPAYAGAIVDPLTGEMEGIAASAEMIGAGFKGGCHNHLAPYIGEEAARFVGDNLGGLVNHCGGFRDLSVRAQSAMQGAYDFVKTPFNAFMDMFARNPLADFGTQEFLDSRFVAAYNAAASSVADTVYALNTVENIALHSFIFSAAAIEGYRQSAPGGGHEARETLSAAKDFFHRTLHDRPLTYVLPVITSGATWAAQGNFDSTTVLAGVTAGATGHIVHRLKHKWDRAAHIKNFTQDAGDLLRDFARAVKEKSVSEIFVEPARKQWLNAKEKMAWAGASLSAYATIVFADVSAAAQAIENDLIRESVLKSSEVLGAATATGLVAGLFVPFNIVEDAAQHVIFGVGGYGFGRTWGAMASAQEKFLPPGGPR